MDPEFKELWKRISQKTTYSVEYSTKDLIGNTIFRFKQFPRIQPPKLHIERASIDLKQKGVSGTLTRAESENMSVNTYIPDVLTILDKELDFKITRHALAEIIKGSGRIDELKLNPQEFIRQLIQVIKSELNKLIIGGIKYEKISESYYEMYQFQEYDLQEYFTKNPIESDKHIYEVVDCDSKVEENFAKVLNEREDIKLFVKLPNWFKIETPLGTYNPDWAIVKQNDKTLYLIKETKGTLEYTQLRNSEEQKIFCGEKHFRALETDVEFGTATNGRQV